VDDDPADQGRDRRRSALPWPDPVRSGPGRWTLLVSAAAMVALVVVALVIVLARM
jgi:hypothetical protein